MNIKFYVPKEEVIPTRLRLAIFRETESNLILTRLEMKVRELDVDH